MTRLSMQYKTYLRMSQNNKNTTSMLSPNCNNHSTTSLTSEAATFHSAQVAPAAEMEHHNPTPNLPPKREPELSSTMMSRTDSGYEPGNGRRSTSTSSSRSRSRRPRQSISSNSSRPTNRRGSKSTPSSSLHRTSPRPVPHSRYTTPRGLDGPKDSQVPYQFFQFPSLSPPAPPAPIDSHAEAQPPASTQEHQPAPLPPATVHYFLLPETRRLEYAAIDAASRGVRGFITKLLPDCILPSEFRRTKFHTGDDDSDNDAGSVRRYRLHFPDPEEKSITVIEREGQRRNGNEGGNSGGDGACHAGRESEPRPGMWRRMMGLEKA